MAVLTIALGRLPWVALTLAVSFGVYGLLRKTVSVGLLVGLSMETALLARAGAGVRHLLRPHDADVR